MSLRRIVSCHSSAETLVELGWADASRCCGLPPGPATPAPEVTSPLSPCQQDPEGATALLLAARAARAVVARLLLAAGAAVDLQTRSGNSALMEVAAQADCSASVLRMLLASGASVDIRNREGKVGTAQHSIA